MSKRRRVILVLGKVGSGKTELSKRIIDQYDRVIVFDPLGEYHGGVVFSSFDEFAWYVRDRLPAAFYIVLRFEADTPEEIERQYDFASRIIWHIQNVLLVVEEAEIYLNSYNRQAYLNTLISLGRHRLISILGISRTPSEISIKLRAQFTTVISFRQTEPRHLDHLEQLGFDPIELAALGLWKYAVVGEPVDSILEGKEYDPARSFENSPPDPDPKTPGLELRVREQDLPDDGAQAGNESELSGVSNGLDPGPE